MPHEEQVYSVVVPSERVGKEKTIKVIGNESLMNLLDYFEKDSKVTKYYVFCGGRSQAIKPNFLKWG